MSKSFVDIESSNYMLVSEYSSLLLMNSIHFFERKENKLRDDEIIKDCMHQLSSHSHNILSGLEQINKSAIFFKDSEEEISNDDILLSIETYREYLSLRVRDNLLFIDKVKNITAFKDVLIRCKEINEALQEIIKEFDAAKDYNLKIIGEQCKDLVEKDMFDSFLAMCMTRENKSNSSLKKKDKEKKQSNKTSCTIL